MPIEKVPTYLRNGEETLPRGVEIAPTVRFKPSAKELSAKQGEYEDEKEEDAEEGDDGADGIEEHADQIAKGMPVPTIRPTTTTCGIHAIKGRAYYLVTLKTRRRRTQRKTDTPSGGMTSVLVSTTSIMLLMTTKQSNRLKRDTK